MWYYLLKFSTRMAMSLIFCHELTQFSRIVKVFYTDGDVDHTLNLLIHRLEGENALGLTEKTLK